MEAEVDELIAEVAVATPARTREELLRLSARGYVPLRHVLVQLPEPDGSGSRAAVLARFVSERKHRALLLYLLLLSWWPWLHDRREPLAAGVWIRALTAAGAPTWSASTLSRAWADLMELGLIEKEREGRLARVRALREDRAGPYDPPAGRKDRSNTYFTLPDTFWLNEDFAALSLPATAMFLLIAAQTSGKNEFRMTYDQATQWFGIKPKTAQKGLTELEDAGLLKRRRVVIAAPFSPTGSTVENWYSLIDPYSRAARADLQRRTAREVRARQRRAKDEPVANAEQPIDQKLTTRPTRLERNLQRLAATWGRGESK